MSASESRFWRAIQTASLLLLVQGLVHLPLSAQERASLTLEPDTVRSEAEVKAVGSGFCGESDCPPVTIRLQGVIVVEQVMPGPDGAFEVHFVAEAGPGRYVVSASQGVREEVQRQVGGRWTEATAELTIELGPRLILEPRAVHRGEWVRVTGVGFSGPYAVDVVSLKLGEEVVVDEVKVRKDGTLEARVAAQVEAGLHRLSVTLVTIEGDSVDVGADLIVAIGDRPREPREQEPPSIER